MAGGEADWQDDLRRWLAPFLGLLGHKARRNMCPLYVAGLIGPGDRKSVQPMASRTAAADYDQLHHFVGAGVWDEAPLERELLGQADRLVGGPDAVLVIDDPALPKKGKHSVGVAPQYATVLGKQANCQTLVSLTLARNEVPVPIALRLYLPEVWTDDAARLAKAGVPQPLRLHRSKSEIALAELDRVLAAGVRFGVVLADAAYGSGTGFRRALSDRDLIWAVGIPRTQKVYASDVVLTWPVASRGRPRQRPVPDIRPVAAQEMLAPQRWRTVTWRRGTKGPLRALFAAVRVRVADGTPTRAGEPLSSTPPRRRGGLARGRAPLHRRTEVLPLEPAARDHAEDARGDHQGALGMRAGSPAAEGRTWPRSLRRPILERPTPARSHEHDRLRIPATSAPGSSAAGKKRGSAHPLSRACPRYGPQSSRSSTPAANARS